MGEAKRRRAAGIGSRTEARREAEAERRRSESEAWWNSLTPEQQEAEREKQLKRKHDAIGARYMLAAMLGLTNSNAGR